MRLSFKKTIDPRQSPIVWGIMIAIFLGTTYSLFWGNLLEAIESHLLNLSVALLIGILLGRWWLHSGSQIVKKRFTLTQSDELELREELSQTGQWYFDLKAKTFCGTSKAKKIYGFDVPDPSQMIATLDQVMERIHPEDRQRALDVLKKTIAGEVQTLDYRIIVDGKIRHLHTNRIPKYDMFGNIIGVYGCAQDITELVEAKLAATASEHKIRKLIDSAPLLIGILKPDLSVEHLNTQYEKALGYTREEIAEIRAYGVTHPDDHEKTKKHYDDIQSGKTDYVRYEKRYVAKDGTTFPADLSVTAIRDQNGKLENILLMALDISDRKKMEEALRQSEERFRIAMSSANIGLWDVNLQTKQIYWTPESTTLIGYPEEVPGLHPESEFFERIHPNDLEKMHKAVQAHIEGKTPEYRCEFRIRHADGRWTWNLGAGKVVEWTEDGKPLRMMGVQIDIERQKQLEFELIQAREKAEMANVAKSSFLANMSHEIRTPMTAILGFTELLESANLDKGEAKEFIKTIQRNGQHLLQLINDILDLSKIDSGWFTIKPEPCDYLTVVRESLEIMRVRATKKGITLYLESEGKLPDQIETDPDRLRQCLINLLGNAIKFTEQGNIRLRLEYLSSWREDQPAVQFEVIDSGIGIPEDKIDLLFTPFMQADESMARRHGGTGLGLAITKQITEMLGGTIQFQSKIGKGSTFTITLPVGKVSHLQMVEIPASAEVTAKPFGTLSDTSEIFDTDFQQLQRVLHTKRILLAEDGPDNQRFIAATLQKAGAEVEIAENGRVAVEVVRANPHRYDLILMDMQMPEMDGYEATNLLREMGIKTPIVALTAHAFVEESQKCLDIGCTGFCTKPIKPMELVAVVIKHLGQMTDSHLKSVD